MNLDDRRGTCGRLLERELVEIRRVLLAVHRANPRRPAGRWASGLPDSERRKVLVASPARVRAVRRPCGRFWERSYDRLSLWKTRTALGAFAGGLLGLNFGLAVWILAEALFAVPIAAMLGIYTGACVGYLWSPSIYVRRRPDPWSD